MYTYLYGICLLFSLFTIFYMSMKNYENIDIHYWSLMIMTPIILLGYFLKTQVTTREGAMVAFSFIYLDSTVMFVTVIFSIVRFLEISLKPIVKLLGYGIAFAHMAVIWLCFDNGLYYKDLNVIVGSYGNVTKMSSGPLKPLHYAYLAVAFSVIIGLLIYGYIKKKTISHRVLDMYSIVVTICLIVYIVEIVRDVDFSILPIIYVLSDAKLAFDYDKVHMHDITYLISVQQKNKSIRGCVAVDLNGNFLGANKTAYYFLPELTEQRIDDEFSEGARRLRKVFYGLISQYKKSGTTTTLFHEKEMTCNCEISKFSIKKGSKDVGYLFDISDVTEERRILSVMEQYNETLNNEVQAKTEDIINIQSKVVIGLANMIENRDNNTGGHVKRTSDIVSLLIDEIRCQKIYDISEEKATDIVRSAPMHDLGKISADSSILLKPGRLTDEEFEIMKEHAQKSGEIVELILEGVEEQHFVDTAFNLARYHHERWDGQGYPEGLAGEQIPVEARIMAVADVYDALSSKRCYKEALDPKKVDSIIRGNMGSQFDPRMLPVYLACRRKLEEYYKVNMG